MNDFLLKEIKNENYKALIIFNNYNDPLDKLDELIDILKKRNISKGKIILDSLLSSGNNGERFIEVFYDGDKFKNGSMNFVSIDKKSFLRKISSEYYRKHDYLLDYSVLCDTQKNMIKNGFII